jgi:hypothetical protein
MRRAEALIAVVAGLAATASPRMLLRVSGIAPREVTGAAVTAMATSGVIVALDLAARRAGREARARPVAADAAPPRR